MAENDTLRPIYTTVRKRVRKFRGYRGKCAWCEEAMTAKRSDAKFCCAPCRSASYDWEHPDRRKVPKKRAKKRARRKG